MQIASPTKALVDRIAREPGFRSMADVARWIEEMRIDFVNGLDHAELVESAQKYGRPAVRWLQRHAEKKQSVWNMNPALSDFKQAAEEVRVFLHDPRELDLWSQEFFSDLAAITSKDDG